MWITHAVVSGGGAWCATGPRGEESKNITSADLRPLSGTRRAWPIHYLALFLSLTHSHTNTHTHQACRPTCWRGLRLSDESRHGRVGVQPVAKHVRRREVEDRAWQTAHLWAKARRISRGKRSWTAILKIRVIIFAKGRFAFSLRQTQKKTGNVVGGGGAVGRMTERNSLAPKETKSIGLQLKEILKQ